MGNRSPRIRHVSLMTLLVLLSAKTGDAAEAPKEIKPEHARQHVGEKVRVKFTVKASKHAKHRETVFLDSEEDFHDEKNLGIAISEKGIESLKKQRGIDAPADHYLNKEIQVIGKVVIREERPYIDIDEASQIEEVKKGESR